MGLSRDLRKWRVGLRGGQLVANGNGRAVPGDVATLSGTSIEGGEAAARGGCGGGGFARQKDAAEQRRAAGIKEAVPAYVPDLLRRRATIRARLGQGAERVYHG